MPEHQSANHQPQADHDRHRKSGHSQVGDSLLDLAVVDPGVAQRARLAPAGLSTAAVLRLQRVIGNQAVCSFLPGREVVPRHGPPDARATETAIHRKLILNNVEKATADDAQADLGADFATLRDAVQELINLPGLPVKVTTAQLKEVDLFRTTQQTPPDRGAKVAALQLLSHGAWTHTATIGMQAKPTTDAFNSPATLKNIQQLGEFLVGNPNVGGNLKAAGVGWELNSRNQFVGAMGGGAVLDERIHIEQWVLQEPGEGFMRMVVHEAGHATFQRMLLTGVDWSDAANKGQKAPEDRALEDDGKKFYQAWQVLRGKPQYFFITDMPGGAVESKGEGRANYLAGQFTEFCAESFMHLALKKDELLAHVAKLPDKETDVKAAWQSALDVLLKHESQILGRKEGGGSAVLTGHRSSQQFVTALKALDAGLQGPNLEVVNIDEVKVNLESLRRAWQGMTDADRQRLRLEALGILDRYIMRVQRRRPAQEHLGSELGFANL